MKLCGIIVAYFPDLKKLKLNIKSVIADVEQLIVWDNTPDNYELKDRLEEFGNKVIVMTDGVNLGIGAALNKGVLWASTNKCTHLLTLDQDSFFFPDNLRLYKSIIHKADMSNIKVGIFIPNLYCNNEIIYSQDQNEIVEVPDGITSGSIVPLGVFENCGFFNEEMFIDAVDYEFCCRVYKMKQYKTVLCPQIMLNHELGYFTKSILGIKTDNYSAFRIYFIIRNHIMLWKVFPKILHKRHKRHLIENYIFKKTLKVLFLEDDKLDKIKSVCKGIYDGIFTKNLITFSVCSLEHKKDKIS